MRAISAASAVAAAIDVAGFSRGTRVGSLGSGIVASARRSDSLIVPYAGALPAATAGFVATAGLAGALPAAATAGFVGLAAVAAALMGAGTGCGVGAAAIVFAGAGAVAAEAVGAVVVAGMAGFAGGAAALHALLAADEAASALTPGGCCDTAVAWLESSPEASRPWLTATWASPQPVRCQPAQQVLGHGSAGLDRQTAAAEAGERGAGTERSCGADQRLEVKGIAVTER